MKDGDSPWPSSYCHCIGKHIFLLSLTTKVAPAFKPLSFPFRDFILGKPRHLPAVPAQAGDRFLLFLHISTHHCPIFPNENEWGRDSESSFLFLIAHLGPFSCQPFSMSSPHSTHLEKLLPRMKDFLHALTEFNSSYTTCPLPNSHCSDLPGSVADTALARISQPTLLPTPIPME